MKYMSPLVDMILILLIFLFIMLSKGLPEPTQKVLIVVGHKIIVIYGTMTGKRGKRISHNVKMSPRDIQILVLFFLFLI